MGDDSDAGQKRQVNKKTNSSIIGKYVKDRFTNTIGTDLLELGDILVDGIKRHLNSQEENYSREIANVLSQIVKKYIIVSLYSKEEEFKRLLFTKLLAKITEDKTAIIAEDQDKTAIIKTKPKSFSDTLLKNISNKLIYIINYRNPRTTGGAANVSEAIKQATTDKTRASFIASQEEDNDPQMKCFISEKTDEIISQFFVKDVDSETVSDLIIIELCKEIYAIYNEPLAKKKLCQVVDAFIIKVIDSISTKIIDDFPPETFMETFYVLLSDEKIHGFVKTIHENTDLYMTLKKKQTPETLKSIFTTLASEIKKTTIKGKAPVYFLEHLNMRLAQTIKGFHSRGGNKISTSPVDYNIQEIITSIAGENYKKIEEALDKQFTDDKYTEVIQDALSDYFKKHLKINLEKSFSEISSSVLTCVFDTLNTDFHLHLFYVSTFYKPNSPLLKALTERSQNVNVANIKRSSGFFGSNVFITSIINDFVTSVTKTKDAIDAQNNKEVGMQELVVGVNTGMTPSAPPMPEAVPTSQQLPPSQPVQVSSPIIEGKTKPPVIVKGGDNPYDKPPPNGGGFFSVYADTPSDFVLNNSIYDIFQNRIVRGMGSTQMQKGLYTQIHQPMLDLLNIKLKPPDIEPGLSTYGILKNTFIIDFVKQSFLIGLRGFTKENPTAFKHTPQLLQFALFGLFNDYLYVNVKSTKGTREFSTSMLKINVAEFKKTYMDLFKSYMSKQKGVGNPTNTTESSIISKNLTPDNLNAVSVDGDNLNQLGGKRRRTRRIGHKRYISPRSSLRSSLRQISNKRLSRKRVLSRNL